MSPPATGDARRRRRAVRHLALHCDLHLTAARPVAEVAAPAADATSSAIRHPSTCRSWAQGSTILQPLRWAIIVRRTPSALRPLASTQQWHIPTGPISSAHCQSHRGPRFPAACRSRAARRSARSTSRPGWRLRMRQCGRRSTIADTDGDSMSSARTSTCTSACRAVSNSISAGVPSPMVATLRFSTDYSPTTPSTVSRMRSAWPLCRAYSSIMCTRIHLRLGASPLGHVRGAS